jgi:hypothetical protein
MTRTIGSALTLVLTLAALPAAAAPLDLTSIAGVWQNPVNGGAVAGEGTSLINWGDGAAPDSGYLFVAGVDILAAAVDAPLLLGTFTHYNEVIPVPNLTGVDLQFGFNTNGAPGAVNAAFAFAHNETPNNTGLSPADDDIVTITTPIVNIPIAVGLDVFYFNLLGFSIDGGLTFQNVFSSVEGGQNSAALYGRITQEPVSVPEPAGLLLFGGALTVIAMRLRSRQRAQASAR